MSDSFKTPCAVAHQAPLFMGFSRQEYWSGLQSPAPGDLENPEFSCFSTQSSHPGVRTHVSCIAGRFYWATWEASLLYLVSYNLLKYFSYIFKFESQ